MSKLMWSTIGIACGVVFATSVQALDNAEKLTDPQQSSPEQINQARERVMASLHDLKDIVGSRSAREPGMCPPGQCYPTCPEPYDSLIAQIQCILCSMHCHKGKYDLCEIDHIDEWIALINAIACQQDPKSPPKDICDALAQLADGLTELLQRVGCGECEISMPDDILGRLCFVASQIEVVDEKIDNIACNVGQLECEVASLTEKVDDIACTVGQKDDRVDCSLINETNCESIMELNLSTIQWLKAIFMKIK